MSLINDYNKGIIDAAELNRRLRKDEEKRRQEKYVGMLVVAVFIFIGACIYGYINHKSNISQECQAKYRVYGNESRADLDAKLDLQKLCREGKD